MKLDTVVAGLDLGPSTARVAAFAQALAHRLDAKLIHLHAEDDAVGPEWAELAVEARRRKIEAAERHSGAAEIVWRPGTAAAALQDEAVARHSGLVVAGTGALGTEPDLSATAIRLLRSLTVPLCLVPTHAGAHASLRSGRVLVPVDFSKEAVGALREGSYLARRLADEPEHARLTALNVVPPPALVAHLGESGGTQLPQLLRDMMERATVQLKELMHAAGLAHVEMLVVEAEDIAEAIGEQAKVSDADVIVMPSHARGTFERLFVGSTTEKVARLSDRPLMMLPPSWLNSRTGATD